MDFKDNSEPLVFGALAVIIGLFLWHSRPGRAIRRGIACRGRGRFAMVGVLGLMAVAGALFALEGYFHAESHSRLDQARAKRRPKLPTMTAASKVRISDWTMMQALDLDQPEPPAPPKVQKPPKVKEPGVVVEASDDESWSDTPAKFLLPTSEPLPDWAKKPYGRRAGEPYRQVVKAGPHATHRALEDELDTELRDAVDEFVEDQIARGDGPDIDVPMSFISERLIADRFDRPRVMSVGLSDNPMVESFVLLEFDDSARRDLQQMWRGEVVSNRLWHTGILGGLMLSVLGTIYSYLRLDTLSKGYYSIRLRLAAAVLIAAAAAAGWLLASVKAIA